MLLSSSFRRVWCGVLVLGLSACGGGGDPAAAPDEPPASVEPTLVVVVGNVADAPADAVHVTGLSQVDWGGLPPGALVRVAGGPQTGPVTITAQGTRALPIRVEAADASTPPILRDGGLDFQAAAWVQVHGLTIEGSPWGAMVIRRGSHHLTVQNNVLRDSYMGVDLSDGAGLGHQILDNRIEDNLTHGIAVVEVDAAAADPTRISGNTIQRNGHHGLELQGSHYVVEHNRVSDNGVKLGGTSGIHLYSRQLDGHCDDNVVRYNFSFHNHDRVAYDGNGIQLDHWCDRNEVSHNVVWGNDGAGIIVFDGADNRVFNNTARGNGQDPKRSVDQLGEIILNSQGTDVDRSRDNEVFNNLLVPTRVAVAGLLIDYVTADNPNRLGPNHYPSAGQWTLIRRGSRVAATQSAVDSLSEQTGNLAEDPQFAAPASVLSHGLRLTRTPSLPGVLRTEGADLLGLTPVDTMSFFGAYYTEAGLN